MLPPLVTILQTQKEQEKRGRNGVVNSKRRRLDKRNRESTERNNKRKDKVNESN